VSDLPVKVLAVLGGAAVGAFAVGALVRLISRLTTRQQLPPWLMFVLRFLGAVVVGWLVALWLFGGGGLLPGGAGGLGFGSGSGGEQKQPAPPSTSPTADKAKPADPAETLRVEILGDPALKRLAGGGRFDADRRYRVEVNGSVRLLSFERVQDLVRNRMAQKPPLKRIDLVLYGDSPAHDLPVVKDLENWAKDRKVQVDSERLDQEAPAR
jgi:hypothetical protein